MPITDYKVTDIERDAVRMQGKADPLQGTLAQNQAEFDEYPELVRDNLDGLCDFIATMPIAYTSSAAAATANKGAITGFVPLGAIVEISMTNGNTSANPTISIDGVTHTFTNMPTTAQVQANSTQTYRFVKSGATVLTFTKNPDYISEYGTNASGFEYTVYASGRYDYGDTYTPTVTSTGGTITTKSVSGAFVIKGDITTAWFSLTITDKGTATGPLKITLPSSATKDASFCGINRRTATAATFQWQSAALYNIYNHDGTSTITNGDVFIGCVTYYN